MSKDVCLKDSGMRREFGTGSVRDVRDGKGRYDLLPPNALFLVARQFEEGARKYGDNNWLKGQPLSAYLDSATRHGFNVLAGLDDENHAVAAAWNWLAFLETRHRIEIGLLPKELNDLPEPSHGRSEANSKTEKAKRSPARPKAARTPRRRLRRSKHRHQHPDRKPSSLGDLGEGRKNASRRKASAGGGGE